MQHCQCCPPGLRASFPSLPMLPRGPALITMYAYHFCKTLPNQHPQQRSTNSDPETRSALDAGPTTTTYLLPANIGRVKRFSHLPALRDHHPHRRLLQELAERWTVRERHITHYKRWQTVVVSPPPRPLLSPREVKKAKCRPSRVVKTSYRKQCHLGTRWTYVSEGSPS